MTAIVTITDSIVVKFLAKDALLTGVGNELHLHTTTGNRVLPYRLCDKVHGIACTTQTTDNDGKLVVYGEKEFMLMCFTCTGGEFNFKLLQRAQLSDWISAASFLDNPYEFVLLTAHSVLLHVSFSIIGESAQCKIISKYSCSDKSTLYCAHLHGNTLEKLIIFGGNAFGELLVWQPNTASNLNNIKNKVELKKRLTAHNGVIFSIDYDAESRQIITTSDDRSIRFWNVVQEETNDWKLNKIVAISSGYGHVARVFTGRILRHNGMSFAFTVGEDSYFCLWRCTGELLWKRRLQFGAVIWNFEYGEDTKTLYTVGSTGNVLAYDLEDVLKNKLMLTSIKTLDGFENTEYVAKAKFLNPHLLIGITNKNRLIYTNVKLCDDDNFNKSFCWQMVSADMQAYKCTVLEVYKDYVALCGYKKLTLFKYIGKDEFQKLYDGYILDGVVRAFHFLDESTFLISDELGNCLLVRGDDLLLRYVIPLPRCKEPWTTTALLIADYLLLSNRLGNLLLYKLDKAGAKFNHIDTLKQPHGNLGATTLQLHEITSDCIFVGSAGHDGALRLLCISKRVEKLKSHLRTMVPIAWVEHILTFDKCELVFGFNDNHFVAWSQIHDVVVQVPCGGGHRCWHYCLVPNTDGSKWLCLLFVKNKMLQMHKMKLLNVPKTMIKLPLRNQWHSRPCNIAALIERRTGDAKQIILISAGDDNLIKISTLEEHGNRNLSNTGVLVQQVELQTHISNIRSLRVVQVNTEEALLFSGGGRAQFCVSRLNLYKFRIEELTSYTLKPAETQVERKGYSLDPETRIMTCDILPAGVYKDDSVAYYAFLGCSDGFLRKLRITTNFEMFPEAQIFYGSCILQVRVVTNSFVLVAGTTGKLHFYDLQLNAIPFQLPHHASGVNALDTLWEPATCVLHVLTGGDDQTVLYTSINITPPMNIRKSFQLKNLHTAQVTAACLRRAPDATLYAYTASIDQNLVKLNVTKEQVKHTLHTCVADVKGLCVDTVGHYFIYGCGIQVFLNE